MKSSEAFKQTIEQYVISVADSNPMFAAKACNPQKNLDDCITYILNQVQRSGINGFTDEEIYSMAIHYYEEEGLDIGKPVQCQVVVNHQVELSEDEIAELKQKAKDKLISEEITRLRSTGKTSSKPKPNEQVVGDGLLFTFD